jgi:hypothetical protein
MAKSQNNSFGLNVAKNDFFFQSKPFFPQNDRFTVKNHYRQYFRSNKLKFKGSVARLGEIPTFWLLWDTFYRTNFQIHKQFQHMVCSFVAEIDVDV